MRLLLMGLTLLPVIALAQSGTPKLTLADAQERATKNNPFLVAARAEVDVAGAAKRLARARTGPQMSLNGFAATSDMPTLLSTSGGDPNATATAPTGRFFDVNLTLMFPLYTGGVLPGLVSSAAALELAAMAEFKEMASDVTIEVSEAYYRSVYQAAQVRAQQARVEATEAMVAVAKAQLDAGKGIEASVRRAEAELAAAKQEFTMAENDRKKELISLLAMMGAPMEELPELEDSPFDPVALDGLQVLVKDLPKQRGMVIAANMRMRAAKAKLDSVKGSTKPQVYGFAMGDAFSPKMDGVRSAGSSIGLAISVPIFDSGMRRADIAEAQAMLRKATAEAEWALVQATKEVRQTWLDLELATQNVSTAETELKAAEASHSVMVIRVESGKGILVEQLDSLAALTRARANLAKAQYELGIATVRVCCAAGISIPGLDGGIDL